MAWRLHGLCAPQWLVWCIDSGRINGLIAAAGASNATAAGNGSQRHVAALLRLCAIVQYWWVADGVVAAFIASDACVCGADAARLPCPLLPDPDHLSLFDRSCAATRQPCADAR